MSAVAIAEPEYSGLTMVCAPAEAQRRMQELQAFVQSAMVAGVDYGVIAGTSGKPSLLQPGAQKLAELYGFAHRFHLTAVKDWERGFFYFEVRCELTHRATGRFVGEGMGSCNSKENRYAQRWVTLKNVPAGVDPSTLRREERPSKFGQGTYDVYLVANEDPYTLVNTIQKMACKRALVHGVLSVTRSSGIFTQDVEDLPPEIYGVVDEQRSWERDARPVAVAVPTPPPSATTYVIARHEMSATEIAAVEMLTPRWVAAKDADTISIVYGHAVRLGGGRKNASRAYMDWAIEQRRQALAAIGAPSSPGPGPVKSASPASIQVPESKAVAS